jgi:hypothetical protein
MRAVGIVGLDLSLRGAAAVIVPASWILDSPRSWDSLTRMTVGYEGGDNERKVTRLHDIAKSIADFVGRSETKHVFVEDYAFGMMNGIRLGELGGAVKAYIYATYGIVTVPMNMSTARKYLLGKIPRGKGAVAKRLTEVMTDLQLPSAWTADERDAWIIANAARAEMGIPGATLGG